MDVPTVEIDGLPISLCTMNDVEGILDEAVRGEVGPLRLATVNLDFLRLASRDVELKRILKGSHHNFADGWPLLQMASLLGRPLPERVTGSDLTPRICEWAARNGWRLAFVGSTDQTKKVLAELMRSRYGDVLVGHWTPDYRHRSIDDPALCSELREAGAQIVLVALGCPRQEQWVWANLEASGARVAMGVGGSLDFMAGVQRRAPVVFRAVRMEWLYRALSQPRRLGFRYLLDLDYYQKLLRRTVRQAHR